MFMYVHIDRSDSGSVTATVKNNGNIPSLGGPNSRTSDLPIVAIRIDEFVGLECISDLDLLNELMHRFTTQELLNRFNSRLTNEELIEMLSDRVIRGK